MTCGFWIKCAVIDLNKKRSLLLLRRVYLKWCKTNAIYTLVKCHPTRLLTWNFYRNSSTLSESPFNFILEYNKVLYRTSIWFLMSYENHLLSYTIHQPAFKYIIQNVYDEVRIAHSFIVCCGWQYANRKYVEASPLTNVIAYNDNANKIRTEKLTTPIRRRCEYIFYLMTWNIV